MLAELSSATLVAWGNAWLAGRVGLDDTVDAVERHTGPHLTEATVEPGLPFEPGVPLRSALARLRGLGLSEFRLCLPVPGDPLGLTGGRELAAAAIEAREAVLIRLADRRIGLVPRADLRGSSYRGWPGGRIRLPTPVPSRSRWRRPSTTSTPRSGNRPRCSDRPVTRTRGDRRCSGR